VIAYFFAYLLSKTPPDMRIHYLLFVIILSNLLPTSSRAQDKKVIDEDSNYVVIGAFTIHENAVQFTATAKKQSFNADYAFNENKKLYYVFVTQTNDRAAALDEAKKLQAQAQYPDTWVYGKLEHKAASGVDINPGTNRETIIVASDKPADTATPASPEVRPAMTVSSSGEISAKYFFRVFSTVTGDSIKGNVDMISIETNKKVNAYPTNEGVTVKSPSKSGDVLFACEILGYRGIKKNVNFNNPLATKEVTQITEEDGQYVLPFELVRLKKGDIAVMYDLFFYKDAAIIRSESRSEVGLLVDMMKENLKYKIMLHGHTNGGGAGKVITMGSDKNYFSLTGSKEGRGSAVKLSEERSNVIKEYLVAQGIDEKRIEVKAWGGKKPLYDVEHALAQSNVRVEVEILED
jgi:outer membrane protein OmpA-like peptidoglycan-associated protein